jgi:hypothetical protein
LKTAVSRFRHGADPVHERRPHIGDRKQQANGKAQELITIDATA